MTLSGAITERDHRRILLLVDRGPWHDCSTRRHLFDCARPASLARFWAAALDGYQLAPYDEEELDRLRSIGITNVEDDATVLVEPTVSGGPRLWFQLVPEPKRVKNRVHLDLRADNVDEELDRLLSLGAHAIDHQPSEDLVILQDREGNEFCLLRP